MGPLTGDVKGAVLKNGRQFLGAPLPHFRGGLSGKTSVTCVLCGHRGAREVARSEIAGLALHSREAPHEPEVPHGNAPASRACRNHLR